MQTGDTITCTDMHTGGEPLRIVESGYPCIRGDTVLEKRTYARRHTDDARRLLIHEPRGHYDMYGAVLVEADHPQADFGVLFLHNEGYSTMCGHAIVALGRYAVDKGLVKKAPDGDTRVNIQCPCGLVSAYVESAEGKTGKVRFHSVPAFAFALDVEVDVSGHGLLKVDIGYGGAFYALVPAHALGVDVRKSRTRDLTDAATLVTAAVKSQVTLQHPDSPELAFLYGTILTDGNDEFSEEATANVCVFADREVDRCPTGSGVTARIAVQYKRGLIGLNQSRVFASGINDSRFTGMAVKETTCGVTPAVVVEVAGRAFYTGTSTFTLEEEDEFQKGFLCR